MLGTNQLVRIRSLPYFVCTCRMERYEPWEPVTTRVRELFCDSDFADRSLLADYSAFESPVLLQSPYLSIYLNLFYAIEPLVRCRRPLLTAT